MSQRASVDHQRIERFLRQLGQRFHGTGRIYLVGGTTMVYEGFREQTLDIDLALELSPQDHPLFIQMVRELKVIYNENLDGYFQDILPRYATESLKGDSLEFQRKFQALKQMWVGNPDF